MQLRHHAVRSHQCARFATVDGVPFYTYALGYLYNTDDLDQANQQVPTNLDQLVATSKALKAGDRAGIAMQPQRGYKRVFMVADGVHPVG